VSHRQIDPPHTPAFFAVRARRLHARTSRTAQYDTPSSKRVCTNAVARGCADASRVHRGNAGGCTRACGKTPHRSGSFSSTSTSRTCVSMHHAFFLQRSDNTCACYGATQACSRAPQPTPRFSRVVHSTWKRLPFHTALGTTGRWETVATKASGPTRALKYRVSACPIGYAKLQHTDLRPGLQSIERRQIKNNHSAHAGLRQPLVN